MKSHEVFPTQKRVDLAECYFDKVLENQAQVVELAQVLHLERVRLAQGCTLLELFNVQTFGHLVNLVDPVTTLHKAGFGHACFDDRYRSTPSVHACRGKRCSSSVVRCF